MTPQDRRGRVFDRIAVVGLGTMGSGIARLLRARGLAVRVFDPKVTDLDGALHPLPEGLRLCSSLEDCVSDADLVFEAAPEDITIKERLLRDISTLTPGVIASNTSTYMLSELAAFVQQPERLIVAHFFNPADVVPLVELVRQEETSRRIVEGVASLLDGVGKTTVVLEKERIGFVANRLQAALLREGLSLVDQGVITAAALDDVVRSGLGPRWAVSGVLGVADLGGLDIFSAVCARVFPDLSDATEVSGSLAALVRDGHLGAKTGKGFFAHTEVTIRQASDRMGQLFSQSGADAIDEGGR